MARQTPDDQPEARSARDQLAGEHDLAAELDPPVRDLSRDVHDRTDRQRERERAALQRETSTHARLNAADARDAAADVRDAAALARDLDAHARGVAMAELDATAQRAEDARPLTGTDVIMRAARNRKQAAQRRVKAAEQRELAAQDRLDAAADRQDAARERMHAFSDREALLTELEREQERRAEALRYQHRAEELARTLQRSLSPPRLPRIAGLDVAAHHEPSAPEDVGGDFYDLFPLGAGRTAFFLGDVCGKGPQAAAVTSLARYTMRTAAMLHEAPEAILSDLNTALLMEAEEQAQTCTAVYGEIDARRNLDHARGRRAPTTADRPRRWRHRDDAGARHDARRPRRSRVSHV